MCRQGHPCLELDKPWTLIPVITEDGAFPSFLPWGWNCAVQRCGRSSPHKEKQRFQC